MTDLPNVKLRTLVSFPASVNGGIGLDVATASGVYTLNLNYSEFGVTAVVPQAAIDTTYYLSWNSLANSYALLPVVAAGQVTKAPVTVTATPATMGASDSSIIVNVAGATTITLLNAAAYPGRWVYLKTLTANTVVSASSNVGALATGTAGTAILAATAGRWALLQSDGTIWQIMAAN